MSIKYLGDKKSPIAEATIHNGIVYLAGQVAEDPVPAGVYEQTKSVLAQIDAVLAEAGSDKSHILKANVWLADIADFNEMNRAWKEWVVPGRAPARATVESKLAFPKWKVEIMIEAAVRA